MKPLLIIAIPLLVIIWTVGSHMTANTNDAILQRVQTEAIIRLNSIVALQQRRIVNLIIENNALKRYIVESEWTDRRWKSRAESNLQQLNFIAVNSDSTTRTRLDRFNEWWEGIR